MIVCVWQGNVDVLDSSRAVHNYRIFLWRHHFILLQILISKALSKKVMKLKKTFLVITIKPEADHCSFCKLIQSHPFKSWFLSLRLHVMDFLAYVAFVNVKMIQSFIKDFTLSRWVLVTRVGLFSVFLKPYPRNFALFNVYHIFVVWFHNVSISSLFIRSLFQQICLYSY